MKVDLNKYVLDDEIPMVLSDAYDAYANKSDHPCSVCKATTQLNGKRMHFHASDVGSCPREVYFKMTKEKASYSKPSWNHPMFLKDGHVHEETILKSFESNPNIIITFGDDYKGNIMELNQSIPFFDPTRKVDVKDELTKFILKPVNNRQVTGRHYSLIAHLDGLGVYKDEDGTETEFIIECKSVKDETWKKIQEGEVDDKWYGQIQTYMFVTGIHRAYLVVKNRISSRILAPIRIDYSADYMIKRLVKLNQVYTFVNYGREVPIPKGWTKKNPECKWCDFSDICWGR